MVGSAVPNLNQHPFIPFTDTIVNAALALLGGSGLKRKLMQIEDKNERVKDKAWEIGTSSQLGYSAGQKKKLSFAI